MEFLVGGGLAAAAGLNAWMPLFLVGLADRFLPAFALPDGWAWLGSDVALWITGILLVVEIVADKIPAVDTVNDVLQTVVRPASGGIMFGAGVGAESVQVEDPSTLFADSGWVPVVVGILIALGVHLAKAAVRPLANIATGGIAGPMLSAAEDASALALVVAAVLLPVAVVVILGALVAAFVALVRRRRRRAVSRA